MNNPKGFDFSADRPIESREKDLLGRREFSESIATAISGWHGDDSLVVALYGPWGSGKSSIKNMVIETLKESRESCPEIVEFNPWEISGHEIITQYFFSEIEKLFGKKEYGQNAKEIAEKIRIYSSILNPVFTLLKSSIPFLSLFPDIEKITSKFEELLKTTDKSLYEAKQDLKISLGKYGKNILVVIDDIDRLTSNEIRLIFRLIKANADFPNMIYLVLFQRDIVENCLNEEHGVNGKEYLEKIVQVGIDIPQVDIEKVHNVLFVGLDSLLGGRTIDNVRWGNIFIPGISHYFCNLRDVYRFLSTLSFHVSAFNKTDTFEVNDIDLIAMEVIRVFEPELYHRLPELKSLLTEIKDYSGMAPQYKEDHKKNIESLLESIVIKQQSAIKEIIKELFPTIEWVFEGTSYASSFQTEWLKDLRVCAPEIFDRYFQFSIPAYDISQTELNNFMSNTSNRDILVSSFNSFHERGLLKTMLDRLDVFIENINVKDAVPFVTSLFDIGELISEVRRAGFHVRSYMYIIRIILRYLRQLDDNKEKYIILKDAMNTTTGIFIPLLYISEECDAKLREKQPELFLLQEENINEFKDICVRKIKEASKSGYLEKQPYLPYALSKWGEWSSTDEPNKWVANLIESDNGLLSFIATFLSPISSQSIHDYVPTNRYRINLKNIEEFVSIEIVKGKIDKLMSKSPELTDKQKLAIKEFYQSIKDREDGKPDDSWRYDN